MKLSTDKTQREIEFRESQVKGNVPWCPQLCQTGPGDAAATEAQQPLRAQHHPPADPCSPHLPPPLQQLQCLLSAPPATLLLETLTSQRASAWLTSPASTLANLAYLTWRPLQVPSDQSLLSAGSCSHSTRAVSDTHTTERLRLRIADSRCRPNLLASNNARADSEGVSQKLTWGCMSCQQ